MLTICSQHAAFENTWKVRYRPSSCSGLVFPPKCRFICRLRITHWTPPINSPVKHLRLQSIRISSPPSSSSSPATTSPALLYSFSFLLPPVPSANQFNSLDYFLLPTKLYFITRPTLKSPGQAITLDVVFFFSFLKIERILKLSSLLQNYSLVITIFVTALIVHKLFKGSKGLFIKTDFVF